MVLLKCCDKSYPKKKKKICVDLLQSLERATIDPVWKKKKKFNVPIMALESAVIGVLNILDVIQCLESTAIGDYQKKKKTLKNVFLKTLKLSLTLSLSLSL